jgi:putative spermidine/putrescine transport system ATP-binding protein
MTTNAGTTAGAGMTASTGAAAEAGGGAGRAAANGAGAPVALHDLSRSFGAVRALDGLSLDIAPGELVALLGPSGSGKTTALRIVAGFESADSGTVSVDGQEVSRVPAAKRDMGMVFQSYSLFPNMTALDNVGFGLRMRKLRAGERNRRAGELLDMVGLTDQARKYPHQMSGGQQQRVALARALAIEPRVLLLDEPLSALDAKVRLQLREQIRSLQQRLGITTLFVTHDQEEALSMADRVGVMKDGKLEQVAVPGQLYAEPATAFVAEFVGIMNRIPGQRRGQDQVSALGAVVPVRGGTAGGPAGDSGGSGDVDVLVRPEGLRIAVQPGGNGIVTDRTFLGSVTRVSVLLSGDVTVKVDQPTAVADTMPLGTSVQVSLPGEAVLVTERR